MFLPELLLWLSKSGWLMLLHLSARSSFPKPLSPDEEAALLARLQGGDREAANVLIEHNLRLVAHIARKYVQPGVDQDDLVSVGSLGLVKAVHTFRPEAGRLTSYASRCIENEILMFSGEPQEPKRGAGGGDRGTGQRGQRFAAGRPAGH